MTKNQALKKGYKQFVYNSGDRFQIALDLEKDDIDFSKKPGLVEIEASHPSFDEESIKDLVANECDGWYYDEVGDDTGLVYDKIKELDFSAITSMINEKLKEVNFYKNSGINLNEKEL